MGLKFGGSPVTGMRLNGLAAVEAKLGGSVVWPEGNTPIWDPPYLYLANGEPFMLLEGTFDDTPHSYYPGGRVKVTSGTPCSLLYPDTNSPGVSFSWQFQSGVTVSHDLETTKVSIADRGGTVLLPMESLGDNPTKESMTIFYTYKDGMLLMGLWWCNLVSYVTLNQMADNGVPASGVTRRNNTMYGVTDDWVEKYHAIAMALTEGGGA